MNEEYIVEQIQAYVQKKLEKEGSGHDWWHVLRVYHNALDIAKHEENVQIFVLKIAALLHDIADHKFGYSDEDRRDIISTLLKEYEVEQKIIDEVVDIVNTISFKRGTNQNPMKTIEGKTVQDADRLDAIGALGIGRTFSYGGYVGMPMYSPEPGEIPGQPGNRDTIGHFYEKLLRLKDKMNTETAKKKAEIRHQTMEFFLEQFYREWNGEI